MMEQKHKDIVLKITGILKDTEGATPDDFIQCLTHLLATSIATAEREFDGTVLEMVIHNLRGIYKNNGEAYQAYKLIQGVMRKKE